MNDLTGIYSINEIDGWIACCFYDVIDAGAVLYVQRFVTGASGQCINVGNRYALNKLPANLVKIA